MSPQVESEVVESGASSQAGSAESGAAGGSPVENQGGAPAAGAKEGEPSPDATEGGEPAKVETPAFVGRSKFKVRQFDPSKADELLQQEIEVPARFKELIKDADSEKEVLEILEKAFGIEAVKGERTHAKKELSETRTQLRSMQDGVTELRTIYARGDIDLFLDKLKIPRERMLKWALDHVEYSQLPPEQQRVFDERRDAQRQAYDAEKRASQTQDQSFQQIRQARGMLLDAGLARPDISQFANSYDAKVGKPGAFRDEVIAAGNKAWNDSDGKVDLTPDQAIEQAMARWSPFLTPAQAAQAPQAPAAPAGTQTGTQSPAPAKPAGTLPNLQGRSQSPMKTAPRSIDDLKKIREQKTSAS